MEPFVTVDFETEAIKDRPHYPPEPVGVSIKYSDEKKSRYYAWGHTCENNCTKEEAQKALEKVWKSGRRIVMHNAKFDYEVATAKMGMKELPWTRLDDTMFLLFLNNPYASDYKLKPSSERLLGMPPDEQDAVRDWLWDNRKALKEEFDANISRSNFGAFISLAPGALVGKYANGDVIRTEKLYKLLMTDIKKRKMIPAYDRERELMPILLRMEQRGVSGDLKRLKRDVASYREVLASIDTWLAKKLKIKLGLGGKKEPGTINLNNGDQLVEVLIAAKKIDVTKLEHTDTGKWASDKDSLAAAVTDKPLNGLLQYRAQLKTCVQTFMSAWLEVALQTDGLIFTTWNQTRNAAGKNSFGARTGRLSSSPNFQNVPKEFKPIFQHEEKDKVKAAKLPKCPLDLPPLPLCRSYIVPWNKDHMLIDRDYSQQELRILGHFEGEALLEAYTKDPWLDVHDYATTLLQEEYGLFPNLDHDKARKPVKNTGFGLIYGMGVGKLALKSDISVTEAKQVKDAYLAIFPGLKDIYAEMKYRARSNQSIRTWGGREYFCEEPKIINGRTQTYDYKMVNTLIQGSAADCTKQAIINLWNANNPKWKAQQITNDMWILMLTVHDEVLESVPKTDVAKAMAIMTKAMQDVKFSVPMLSDGKVTTTNWAQMQKYDAKGVIVYNPKGDKK